MDVRTFRARTIQDALRLVRQELGPDAAILHTRDVQSRGLFGLLRGPRQVEVTASTQVAVPRRLPPKSDGIDLSRPEEIAALTTPTRHDAARPQRPAADDLRQQLNDLQSMVEALCRRSHHEGTHDLPDALFQLFTDLIEAEVSESLARELVDRVRRESRGTELNDAVLVKARIARMIEDEIQVAGPIALTPGQTRVAALVGPTGVGKTTTIAKLAANYRLKQRRKIGLITVDTYRIAAVEQLRTYADIIDLPMAVVSTPRDMRDALARMSDLDLVLMDTAGRSPRDEIKIQELKAMLAEAKADEVHLVLSAVGSAVSLIKTAEQFSSVVPTALLLTKLDEATGLGNLLPLVRASHLPLSYMTDGQNVPDDIAVAEPRRLARLVLGMHGSDP
jgi:flagellar biosynthesis protein FlhF